MAMAVRSAKSIIMHARWASQRTRADTYCIPIWLSTDSAGLSKSDEPHYEPSFDGIMFHGLVHDYGSSKCQIDNHARAPGQSAHQG